jgi:hypothetical protein
MAARPDVTAPARGSAGTVQVRLRVALLAERRLPAAQEIFGPLAARQPDVQHPERPPRVFALQEMSDGLGRAQDLRAVPNLEPSSAQVPHQALPQLASRVLLQQAQLRAWPQREDEPRQQVPQQQAEQQQVAPVPRRDAVPHPSERFPAHQLAL